MEGTDSAACVIQLPAICALPDSVQVPNLGGSPQHAAGNDPSTGEAVIGMAVSGLQQLGGRVRHVGDQFTEQCVRPREPDAGKVLRIILEIAFVHEPRPR